MGLGCALVVAVPLGTTLGLVRLFWMLLSGPVLVTRGAILPGVSGVGLSERAARRAWAALGRGSGTRHRLGRSWARVVEAAGLWQPQQHATLHPVAVAVTGFDRPRVPGCATRHAHAGAGTA